MYWPEPERLRCREEDESLGGWRVKCTRREAGKGNGRSCTTSCRSLDFILKEYREMDSLCGDLTLSDLHSKWGRCGIHTGKQWGQNWVQGTCTSPTTRRSVPFPTVVPGCRGQRWTVQTCLTCQRSQRFLNDPGHVLWGDRPEAQLGGQAGKKWTKTWDVPGGWG